MLTTRHPVDFPYTRPELEALFQYARDHVVEKACGWDGDAPDTWEEDGPLGIWIMRVCPVCGTEVFAMRGPPPMPPEP